MVISGLTIAILTFPGVIVHELAHQLFCRLCNVAVFNVCYFQFKNPAGYVVHERPKHNYQSIFIQIGPFIINTIIGILITLLASSEIIKFENSFLQSILKYILMWLGISILMHAFPSTGDTKNMLEIIKSKETSMFTKIIGAPILVLTYIGELGSVAWLDLIYAATIYFVTPYVIMNMLA